jgi:aspartyl protease family protein
MRLALPLGLLAAAAFVLVLSHGQPEVLGMEPTALAAAASLLAIGIVILGSLTRHFQGRLGHAVEAAAFWLAALTALVAAYSFRFELAEAGTRVISAVVPGFAVTGRGGEVSIMRQGDGHFSLSARINGAPSRFIFDTGASMVVITPQTARAAGLDVAKLDFSVPVATANGRTMAAPVRLDRLAVGGIEERHIEALVAKPGALADNLLGMSFLGRLSSYEVRGDRLVLRGAAR